MDHHQRKGGSNKSADNQNEAFHHQQTLLSQQ